MGRGRGRVGLPENIINVKHKSCCLALKRKLKKQAATVTAITQRSADHFEFPELLQPRWNTPALLSRFFSPIDTICFSYSLKHTPRGQPLWQPPSWIPILNRQAGCGWLALETWSGFHKPPATHARRHTRRQAYTIGLLLQKLKHLSRERRCEMSKRKTNIFWKLTLIQMRTIPHSTPTPPPFLFPPTLSFCASTVQSIQSKWLHNYLKRPVL